jgi:chemotaxis protein methyltransferase CheR
MAFRQMNLLDPPVDAGKHSIVFCRNVMIYFNRETQRAVVQSLAERLLPGGYLFIGHSETLSGCECDLEYVRPAIYRRRR